MDKAVGGPYNGSATNKGSGALVCMNDILARREEILRIAAEHGARDVRLFGSVVRGEEGTSSDVDVLVHLDDDRSLLDHVALIQDLGALLGCKVDVVNEEALHWVIRDQVLKEAVPL